MSALLLTALTAAAVTPSFVFGSPELGWFILAADGVVLERFVAIDGHPVEDVALSPDGKTFVFFSPVAVGDDRLAAFSAAGTRATARRLSEREGHFAAPSFSADGAWVFFAHAPEGGPGKHGPGRNAQVFRVRVDGSGFEQLTETRGCKLGAAMPRNRTLYFLHSSCSSTAIIASVVPSAALAAQPSQLNLTELQVAPDGQRAIVVERRLADAVLHEVTLATGRWKQLAAFEPLGSRQRPQWSRDGTVIAVQSGTNVWTVGRDGRQRQLAELKGASR